MTPIEFIILSLATWRVSSLLVREDGPFLIFRRLREWTGIRHDEDGATALIPETFWAGLLSCVWCCSVWVGLGWGLLWMATPATAFGCALPVAVSGAAIWVEEQVGD